MTSGKGQGFPSFRGGGRLRPRVRAVPGGLVNVVTRSGSNEFTGETSYLYSSDALASEAEPTILALPTGKVKATPRF